MLDIKFIRENPEAVKGALKKRNVKFDLDYFLQLDEKRRGKIKGVDDTRARQNQISEKIAGLEGEEKAARVQESKGIKTHLGDAEFELKALEEEFLSLMYRVPNIPLDNVPTGKDELENVILREVGEKPKFDFPPHDYMEIATRLDLIDVKRAAKVSGARFGYLKNEAVLLEMALVQYAFSKLREYNFSLLIPPVLIKQEMMRAMGYIDSEKDSEERYFLEKDKMYLVGTSEQSIAPMHANEIFGEDTLPLRYAGFSTCFRREAGSYGKDTRGILRVHQFDKVEMVIFARPEDSEKEHELMIAREEGLMRELGIPYRVVALCTGDIAHPSARTVDIESWMPGQNKGEGLKPDLVRTGTVKDGLAHLGEYRETHSSSNTTDFQARRLNTKIRRKDGITEYVHILNGTAFAMGRILIAILENYQQKDGSVKIPEALQPYLGGLTVIKRS